MRTPAGMKTKKTVLILRMIHRYMQGNNACWTEQLKLQVQDNHTPEY